MPYRDREEHRKNEARFRAANPEKVRERSRKYREANREKLREKSRAYYQKNKTICAERYLQYRHRERDSGRTVARRLLHKAWYVEYKATTPCFDCGRVYPAECMDFDHLREKSGQVSTFAAYARSKAEEEMKKCQLVCANCHRVRTQRRVEEMRRIKSRVLKPALTGFLPPVRDLKLDFLGSCLPILRP